MGLISNGSTIFDAGAMSAGFGSSMVFIKKLTASSSSTLSFVDGASGVVLDDTYKEYVFTYNNMHPQNNGANFTFQTSTNGGSSYGVTNTSAGFVAYHAENNSEVLFGYNGVADEAQSTNFQILAQEIANANDSCCSGTLNIFNPSSTTFVKHWIARTNNCFTPPYSQEIHVAGYFNTTSDIDAIQFKMSSGNIDAGDICLYGIA